MREPVGHPEPAASFFYGWIVAVAGFAATFVALGTRLSFGVFFTSLELEFSLNRAMTSGIFSVYMLLCCFVAVCGGWISDRWGPRAIMVLMGVFTSVALVMTAMASTWWHLVFSYGLLLAIGTGAVYPVVTSTASRWFYRKRGLAVGITSAGGGVGAIFIVPLSAMLISRFGWRFSLWVLGIAVGLVMVSTSFFLRADPGKMGLRPDGNAESPGPADSPASTDGAETLEITPSGALRMKDFWFLFANWLLLSGAVHLVIVHVAPCAIDRGLSVVDAAFVISLIGIASIPGRLSIGRASDIFGRRSLSVACGLLQASALIGFIAAGSTYAFFTFGLLFGFGWGGFSTIVTAAVGDIFGTESLGSIMGILAAAWALGAAIGPAAGGLVFDASGSYAAAFAAGAISLVTASGLVLTLKFPARKGSLP